MMPMQIVPQEMIRSINSFPLLAIPFFILAGFLMQTGGIASDVSSLVTGTALMVDRGGLNETAPR
jgi:TRAP-type C4-dicarboxylate transport system permease large subunit